jgi:hypothetical protein
MIRICGKYLDQVGQIQGFVYFQGCTPDGPTFCNTALSGAMDGCHVVIEESYMSNDQRKMAIALAGGSRTWLASVVKTACSELKFRSLASGVPY